MRMLATPAVIKAVPDQEIQDALDRHFACDWGDLCDEDRQANMRALSDGSRLLSAYHSTAGVKFWVITEARNDQGKRESTTVLLPEEY